MGSVEELIGKGLGRRYFYFLYERGGKFRGDSIRTGRGFFLVRVLILISLCVSMVYIVVCGVF